MALSYVWGNLSITSDIIFNNIVLPVTTNLASALRHISSIFGETILWVDTICQNIFVSLLELNSANRAKGINQKNLNKRQSKVQLMNTIYYSAERIIAWLVSDENICEYALRLLDG